jgi:hypothetical protein
LSGPLDILSPNVSGRTGGRGCLGNALRTSIHYPRPGTPSGSGRAERGLGEVQVASLPDHRVDLAGQGGPVRIAVAVAGQAGQAGVFAEGGMEGRDRLR